MTPFLVEFLVGRKLLPTLARRRERLYSRLRPARRARNVGSGGGGTCARNRLESCPRGGVEGERSFARHCFDASGRVRGACPRHVIVAGAAERSGVDLKEVSCGKVASPVDTRYPAIARLPTEEAKSSLFSNAPEARAARSEDSSSPSLGEVILCGCGPPEEA